jgi:hypothetical protein
VFGFVCGVDNLCDGLQTSQASFKKTEFQKTNCGPKLISNYVDKFDCN